MFNDYRWFLRLRRISPLDDVLAGFWILSFFREKAKCETRFLFILNCILNI